MRKMKADFCKKVDVNPENCLRCNPETAIYCNKVCSIITEYYGNCQMCPARYDCIHYSYDPSYDDIEIQTEEEYRLATPNDNTTHQMIHNMCVNLNYPYDYMYRIFKMLHILGYKLKDFYYAFKNNTYHPLQVEEVLKEALKDEILLYYQSKAELSEAPEEVEECIKKIEEIKEFNEIPDSLMWEYVTELSTSKFTGEVRVNGVNSYDDFNEKLSEEEQNFVKLYFKIRKSLYEIVTLVSNRQAYMRSEEVKNILDFLPREKRAFYRAKLSKAWSLRKENITLSPQERLMVAKKELQL